MRTVSSTNTPANTTTMLPSSDGVFDWHPVAHSHSVVQGDKYRFTVLTPALIRMEYSPDGTFEDRASSLAVDRQFEKVDFKIQETDTSLEIHTSQVWLQYAKNKPFAPGTLYATMLMVQKGEWGQAWRWKEPSGDSRREETRYGNLGGTVRTLDRIDGRVDMGNGVLSKGSFAQLNDHDSMLFTDDGWVASRVPGRYDGYLFGHAYDHRWALRDYFKLSGRPPAPPREALGVWYTRFHAYTAEEYLEIMDKFHEEGVPLSIAVIDIAWHIMDKTPRGTGGAWSGFTWEKGYYPDPVGFLKALHDRGLKTALNDHPNEGIRYFETKYKEVCEYMGRDPSTKLPIPFEVSDRKFVEAYFKVILHDLEAQGVDIWWVDWQQNDKCFLDHVDPLWILNHFHFLDHAKKGKRGMTLSRFAGPGGHRYPLGFSGDHQMTWESLNFEPEFTATASNIGFGWWSHDIGAHLGGYKDEECIARWCQLGVVMPVLRLHNNCNPFNYRMTWHFSSDIRASMISSFRLRHRLIPYIYTAGVNASLHSRTLMEPMYYEYPLDAESYDHRNAYMYGGQILAVPITQKASSVTKLGKATAWLPKGRWVDILSGLCYDGDRVVNLYRDISTMPLLAQQGAIIPMDAFEEARHGVRIPEAIEITLVVGADGTYDLLEDDGKGNDMTKVNFTRTTITYDHKSGRLSVSATSNPLVKERTWSLSLPGCNVDSIKIEGKSTSTTVSASGTKVKLGKFSASTAFSVDLGKPSLRPNPWRRLCWNRIDRAETDFGKKESTWNAVRCLHNSVLFYEYYWHPDTPEPTPAHVVISRLLSVGVDRDLEDALMELLLAEHIEVDQEKITP